MPRLAYLVAILVSIAGMLVIDRRLRLAVLGRRLVATVAVVEIAFLTFDLLGAARGWFASDPAYVSALVSPGIPPEEPLMLGFLAYFSLVVLRLMERWTRQDHDDA